MSYNGVPDTVICAVKIHYPTASSAWEALRRFTRRQKTRSKKDERMNRKRGSGTPLSAYHCRCGQGWALGHQSASAVAMNLPRR